MRTSLHLLPLMFLFATSGVVSAVQTPDSSQAKSLGDVAREVRHNRTAAPPPDSSALADTPINDSRWRISPEKINLSVGQVRELQVLDDLAKELPGAIWSVDDPALAGLSQKGDHVIVHTLAPGTVRVSAVLDGETRSRDIRIWTRVPQGMTRWGLHPIGREIGDMFAVPGNGPDIYSLEQTSSGNTYLRADSADGIQVWTWLMPDTTSNVELVCLDWLGGAIIAATDAGSYTLYAVGKDGNLRWRHTLTGIRKSMAISTDHLVFLVTGSQDGTAVNLTGIDESSGEIKFDSPLPSSRMIEDRVQRKSSSSVCASNSSSALLPIVTSQIYVNMDGLAYLAFTQRTRTTRADCAAGGGIVNQKTISLTQDDELILWQIHLDGTYRTSLIEGIHRKQPLSQSLTTIAPSRGLVTDNMNGTLIPVESLYQSAWGKGDKQIASFVYRVNPEGRVVYKSKMPQYTGTLHDAMVIGGDSVGFATRGDILIAFNIETGEGLWHWKSSTDEIEVRAALANGHCLIQTSTALVEVEDSTTSKVTAEGKFILNWQGQLLRVHH